MNLYQTIQNNPTLFMVSVIVSVCGCIVIMITYAICKLENRKSIARSNVELKKITNSIHAGLVQFIPRENCSIHYASMGFYELLGYSKKEEKNDSKFNLIDFIYLKDRDSFLETLHNIENETINSEVRLVKKDGLIIYCLMNGNYVIAKDGSQTVSAVFVDITEQKQMQETLRLDRERYRIAAELSNDVLFDYLISEDKMVFTERYRELFGKDPVILNYAKDSYSRKDTVHPDDYGLFLEFCSNLAEGKELVTAEFRLKNHLNNYIWCQLMGKTIYDEDKKPLRVIGKIVNVDYQKRELDALEYKATRDPLTGVYNREVTMKKIEKYISGNKHGRHALIFIDFDNFKHVNDNYGHLVGDKILTYIIGRIKSVLTEGEIIGRIGGDEFIVFIGYIDGDEDIKRKADTIVEALDTTYKDDKYSIKISGSIGIALYPEDGLHYEQLIQSADKALYCVKNKGKNHYMFYKSIT